jgi:hypothetical protein
MAVSGTALNPYYDEILGTSRYYDDPAVFPRFQLLESLTYYAGRATTGFIPRGAVTLVGWTEEPQLDVNLAAASFEVMGTTLYFVELPFTQVVASGTGIEVPQELLSWRVLAENGLYTPSVIDFYMPPGWVELEYEPWPAFHAMDVTGLEIVLRRSPGEGAAPPQLRLWDWEEDTWVVIPNAVWGRMNISAFNPFVGEQNKVRLRLQNDNTMPVSIREVYPLLTGDLQ